MQQENSAVATTKFLLEGGDFTRNPMLRGNDALESASSSQRALPYSLGQPLQQFGCTALLRLLGKYVMAREHVTTYSIFLLSVSEATFTSVYVPCGCKLGFTSLSD